MSKVFVTRQPIFDRDMITYGYELCYQGANEAADKNQTNAALLDSVIYEDFGGLIDDTCGFITFSEKLLLEQIPQMLPSDSLVVQIPDGVPVTDALIKACATLKTKGYTLALDGFWLGETEQRYGPIMPYIDMVKLPYADETKNEQMELMKKYRNQVMMVASGVHTFADHQSAIKMGYHLFQGFFFSELVVTSKSNIGSLSNNLALIANELGKPEPDYRTISQIFESDVDLSYKLLRMANSVYYGAMREISSIRHALIHIGTQDLLRWCSLMLIKGIENATNAELIKASLIRGKLLALLAAKLKRPLYESDYFIAGIFSSIDVLLGEGMNTIIDRLPLSPQVQDALVGADNELRRWLDAIMAFEKMEWDELDAMTTGAGLSKKEFMAVYLQSLRWCLKISNNMEQDSA